MFCAMMVSACEDRVPSGSPPSAAFIAARTSGGKSVDVRTMSCRMLSKKTDGIRAVYWVGFGSWDLGFDRPYRIERDPLGDHQVPADAYYGVQTMRAAENFPISGLRAPAELVTATILVKKAAAEANAALGRLDAAIARAIVAAADE